MPTELLPSLLKAGGVAALAIGVAYLLYREIIKLGVVPKLKQWQGFALLCLLAILVFVIVMTVLVRRPSEQQQLVGELPSVNHFQLDAIDGIYCEKNNVSKPFAPYFDSIDINLGACNGSDQFGSRSYRVDWQPSKSKSETINSRRGYDHCFASDFSERAPKFLQEVQRSFEQDKDAVPCKVSFYMIRQIRVSYVDLRNQSRAVAFIQLFNRDGSGKFEIEQVGTINLARSAEMESLAQEPNGGIARSSVLRIAGQYNYPGVPRQ
jgi:hypothetical protein